MQNLCMLAQVVSTKGSPAHSYPLISWLLYCKTCVCLCWSWAYSRFGANACLGVSLAALACGVASHSAFGLACGVIVASLCSSTALCAFAGTLMVSGFLAGCAMVSWCVIVGVGAGVGAAMLACCGLGMYAWSYVQAGGGVFSWLRYFVKVCMGPVVSVASLAYSCVRGVLGMLLASGCMFVSSLSWVGGCACVCLRMCMPAFVFRPSV